MATNKKLFKSTPTASASMAPWLGIAAIIILCDQLTKIVVNKLFVYGEEKVITSFFNLVLAYNKGAAFSFLANESGWQRHFFTAIGVAAVAYMLYLLRRHSGQRLFCWSMALLMGGAIGNVIDRVLYGHVIDFLDFHFKSWGHFPAFNIADSAITLGAILLIVDELRRVNKN
jgi:signal peptidase II